ncbi:MAG: flagellar export protein FliJ [Solirubrobacteraceae bacterium]
MNGASYRFRLERVRALRERREEQAKQAFATALQQRQRSHEAETSAQVMVLEARREQLRASAFAQPTAAQLRAHQLYLERVEQAHRVAAEQLHREEQTLNRQRVALTSASQDREALERLKQKGLAEHRRETARVEQNLLDEIAGIGRWRRAACPQQ